jgi:hypothetical protein
VTAAVVLSTGSTAAVAFDGQPLSPAALRADLRFAIETIEQKHPDLTHSVDPVRLTRAVDEIERSLDRPLGRDQAWAALARLNPIFADGHLFIGFPDWREEARRALEAGTGFFPFEVALDGSENVTIVAALGGGETPLAGARIRQVNGVDIQQLTQAFLARTHGDSPAFRAALLAQRWWLYQWKMHGAPQSYDLVLDGAPTDVLQVPASSETPAVLRREMSFERQFRFELLHDDSALLTIGSFVWQDRDRFFTFTRDAFTQMREAGVRRLIIDIRHNEGGDDQLWIDGILRYIAGRPYKTGSHYVLRVLKDNKDKGQVAGQLVTGMIETENPAFPDNTLHFDGEVHILVGPLTYSSAVLFSNVVQDYGFGTVVGVGGAVRARQSGGVQSVTLPNTGLRLYFPRFVLNRPSGRDDPIWLLPDRPLELDSLHPQVQVEDVLSVR